MTTNNINKRLKQLQAYVSSGSQTIIKEIFDNSAVDFLDVVLFEDTDTNYLDPQCGSGPLLIYLAQLLRPTV